MWPLCAQSTATKCSAWDIRRSSRTAQPNSRIVSIADRVLKRDGRMIRAIDAIGLGDAATEGHPFQLDLL